LEPAVHKQTPLPVNSSLAYQYILAGNGVFIRAETSFFAVLLPIAPCPVRGLLPLKQHFRLKVPPIPGKLLNTVLADARRARRTDGGLNEVLYHFHHHGRTVQVKKPAQQATAVSVITNHGDGKSILCDLHSHGNMRAFFSQIDDADEQAAKVYAVIGKLESVPEIRLRVGVYGYWMPLPITAVFSDSGPFNDLSQEEQNDNQCQPSPRA
jgi:PRTRC genetic system protein A